MLAKLLSEEYMKLNIGKKIRFCTNGNLSEKMVDCVWKEMYINCRSDYRNKNKMCPFFEMKKITKSIKNNILKRGYKIT